ncbi:pentatricopeptide repeat-containing protein At2g20540 isoform X2 [Ziziphus jujuba]|uniref:Pentatricopeptide repeat-containing protein At2g20540 isoform X2 n=1 Tax=Ziziphus jujuba TaxID=326968 RepID=A0ABM3IPW6_ZIZJJ|nr:pentatricopeptide repeat-containing protein At2g20540 isoform X2 [Ziziphus jujuba]
MLQTGIRALSVRELENFFAPSLRNSTKMAELKRIHAHIVKFSLSQSNFLVTKMLDVCDSNGEVDYASLLFKHVVEPNVFLFNAMIRVYTHNDIYSLAVTLYKQMLKNQGARNPIFPDKFTFPFVVKSCAGLLCQDLDAHRVFEEMGERDVISWNCLLSGHAKLGQMRRARSLFEEMPNKTIVSWTTMISGYTRIGCYSEALDIFRKMQMLGIEPDEISVVSVLPACAQLGALEVGKWIHIYSERIGLLRSTCICNALIEMYAKCGCIDPALQLFNQMLERDVISWSTVIGGLANHGKAREAIGLFQDMQRAGIEPNGITFLGLLSACGHAGFWNEGLRYFDSMKKDYQLEPEIEHYGCLVDLLGRAGRLDHALEAVKKMPMKPDAKIWGSLLNSCRTHCNVEIAVVAMEQLSELEPDDTGNYVLLSNIYADVGKWESVSKIRKLIRSKSMKKTPGCSLIEVNNVVQEFVAGDDSKPFAKDVFAMLDLLASHENITSDMIEIAQEDSSIEIP